MVKLGWLHDQLDIVGGAEISGSYLTAPHNVPDGVEVVMCRHDRRPPAGIDAFVLTNVITYDSHHWIEELEGKTVIKHFRDPWHPGDVIFRRWVLDHAALVIFNSMMAARSCPWPMRSRDTRFTVVPPPVDLAWFRSKALPPEERDGNIFVGRIDFAKGAHRAIDWALANDEPLDLYGEMNPQFQGLITGIPGNIRFHNQQPYDSMPMIYGKAKRFVFLPGAEESYSRTTVEAWAAGCELVIDESKIGATEWLKGDTSVIDKDAAITAWWDVVLETLDRG